MPFLLRTGKRLAISDQRVTLVLRQVEGPLTGLPCVNAISVSLAGAGALEWTLVVKEPGAGLTITSATQKLALDDVGRRPAPALRRAAQRRPGGRPLTVHQQRRAGPRLARQ